MSRRVIREFIVPKGTGKGFVVKKGQVLRVIEIGGGQVADIIFLNAHNYKEQFAARHSVYLNSLAGDLYGMRRMYKLYSNIPWENLMLRVIDDKVGEHCFGSHCSRKGYEIRAELGITAADHPSCSDMFEQALTDFGVSLEDLDSAGVFNVFMKETIDKDGTLHIVPSPAQDGDSIDFLAEMDVLVGFSNCPAGPPTNREELKDIRVRILE